MCTFQLCSIWKDSLQTVEPSNPDAESLQKDPRPLGYPSKTIIGFPALIHRLHQAVRAFAQEKLFRVPARLVCAEGRLPSVRPSSVKIRKIRVLGLQNRDF